MAKDSPIQVPFSSPVPFGHKHTKLPIALKQVRISEQGEEVILLHSLMSDVKVKRVQVIENFNIK